ncbi:MAG: histidine triad nucleotide-binding protein [Alphaproteobacteria bacterium]
MTRYDKNNIFAKILRGEIPCKRVYEDNYALAFHDIKPQAPIHILVIPKGQYVAFDDFSLKASVEEIRGFYLAVAKVAAGQGLTEDGYRIISNAGVDGGQEVPHFHVHLVGGRKLGAMLQKKTRSLH